MSTSAQVRQLICEGKVIFHSWSKAEGAVKRMRRHWEEVGLAPYRCHQCGRIHVGHVHEQFAHGKKQDDPVPHLQACKEGRRKLEELLNK